MPNRPQVRLECNAHFCLSGAGAEMPRCLPSGAWEQAKTCEPIMCAPYVAPPHAVVVPSAPVPAGQQVLRTGSLASPAHVPSLAARRVTRRTKLGDMALSSCCDLRAESERGGKLLVVGSC